MYEQHFASINAGTTLVAASKRLARALNQAYNKSRLAAGDTAWATPDIVSWADWLERLWESSRLLGGRGAALSLLSETDSAVLWEQLIIADQGVESDSADMARLAASAWKIICDCNALTAPEWVESGLSTDQQQFLRWSGAFRDTCKEHAWLDAGNLAGELKIDIEASLFGDLQPLAFAGFDNWSVIQTELKDALAQQRVPVTIIDSAQQSGTRRRVSCATTDTELEQAARWARAQLQADPNLTVAVVVPDLADHAGTVQRQFMDVFDPGWRAAADAKPPVNLSFGEALANKPRAAAAINLLQMIEGLQSYEVFSLALRTPFLKGGREEAGGRAQLDLKLRRRLGAVFYASEALPLAAELAPEFSLLLTQLENARADLVERDLAGWAVWITDILTTAGWPGSDTLDSQAWQELDAWHRLLADFAASARVRGTVTWQTARRLLTRLAWQRLHQPKGASGAVQIMGMLETAGHEFERLWVTGMCAADWPGAAQPNPLVPFGLQRRYELPGSSPTAALAQARAITERLEHSAAEAYFSSPRQRDGQVLAPSRLIEHLDLADDTPGWQQPLWAQQMFAQADQEILDADRPDTWPDSQPARGGAYLFNLQNRCPLRAFLELRVGAEEIDAPEAGLGYRERGSFAHAVLEAFYREHQRSEDLASLNATTLTERLELICQRRMQKLPGMQRRFMRTVVELEIQRLLPLLTEFIALDQARDAFIVTATELEQEIRVGSLRVRVKLDRLDELADGAALVIDYKTGKVSRSDWNPAKPGDVQLPLYASCTDQQVTAVAFAQLSAHGVKLEGLGDSAVAIAIDGIITPDKYRGILATTDGEVISDWNALKAAWQAGLEELADDFVQGSCSVNPKHSEAAQGQFAVLTRVYDLPADPNDDSSINDREGN